MNPRDQSKKVAAFLHTVRLVHASGWNSPETRQLYTAMKELDTPTLYILAVHLQTSMMVLSVTSQLTNNRIMSAKVSLTKLIDKINDELSRRYPDD